MGELAVYIHQTLLFLLVSPFLLIIRNIIIPNYNNPPTIIKASKLKLILGNIHTHSISPIHLPSHDLSYSFFFLYLPSQLISWSYRLRAWTLVSSKTDFEWTFVTFLKIPDSFLKFLFIFWPDRVVCLISVSQPGIESQATAVKALNPNH